MNCPDNYMGGKEGGTGNGRAATWKDSPYRIPAGWIDVSAHDDPKPIFIRSLVPTLDPCDLSQSIFHLRPRACPKRRADPRLSNVMQR